MEEIVTESERVESIPVPTRKSIDTEKLRIVLTGYFDETDLDFLCRKIGTSYQVLGEGNKAERVRALIAYSEKVGMTTLLLREAFALYKRQQSIPP